VKRADLIAGLLAAFLTLAFIGAIVMLSWRSIPKDNEQLLTYMLGQLSGFVAAAVGVYFSRRAEDKGPTGTPEDPVSIAGPAVPAPPVQTEEKTDA
jgi:hypothetical protein